MCVALRDAGEPLPRALALLSPWLDLTCTSPSWDSRFEGDPILDHSLRDAAERYLDGADPRDPLCSPLFADLVGPAPDPGPGWDPRDPLRRRGDLCRGSRGAGRGGRARDRPRADPRLADLPHHAGGCSLNCAHRPFPGNLDRLTGDVSTGELGHPNMNPLVCATNMTTAAINPTRKRPEWAIALDPYSQPTAWRTWLDIVDVDRALHRALGRHVLPARRLLLARPRGRHSRLGLPASHLHPLPRLHARLAVRVAQGEQRLGRGPRARRDAPLQQLALAPRRPPRERRRPGPPRPGRRADDDAWPSGRRHRR